MSGMSPELYERAVELFHVARQLPVAEREAFINASCDGGEELRRTVVAMLAQDEKPAVDLEAGVALPIDELHSAFARVAHDRLPTRIGRYRIIERLGVGGMGVVYRAEQDHPRREVALKLIRAAALGPGAVRRFEHEARLLGRLQHPGIAQIYDAGTADDGEGAQPFFAMELVQGEPITEYARRHQLTIRERLELMLKVAAAVQHAHLRGVIHRDLKPANILVSDGLPKILDFGVARAIDPGFESATLLTAAGQIVGTIGYMAPEQLAPGTGTAAAEPDIRCDVYALGAVLHELLADRPAFDVQTRTMAESIRLVTEHDPAPLGRLDRRLRGELEVIVAKAMEKSRDRRYQSVDALAADVRAFLESRPIAARPPGATLRVRKWCRRRPALASSIGVAVAALFVVVAAVAMQRHQFGQRQALEAEALLGEATRITQLDHSERDDAFAMERELRELEQQRFRYNSAEEQRSIDRRVLEIDQQLRGREQRYHRTQELLSRAERLGAATEDVQAVRAQLYLTRYLEAKQRRDRSAQKLFMDLLQASDPEGTLEATLHRTHPVTLTSDPPGAEVHAFRLVEQSEVIEAGEPRLVPVPFGDTALPTDPGAWALRVTHGSEQLDAGDIVFEIAGWPVRDVVLVSQGSGDVQRFDRLISIDDHEVRSDYEVHRYGRADDDPTVLRRFTFERPGGAPIAVESRSLVDAGITVAEPEAILEAGNVRVRAWRHGEVVEVSIDRGLQARTTAAPLCVSDASLLGRTPVTADLPEGEYVMLFRAEGREDVRSLVLVSASDTTAQPAELPLIGSAPPGFVYINNWSLHNIEPFWIMEHEVTLEDYLAFLNDREIQARIEASDELTLVSRLGGQAVCERDASGRYVVPDDWQPRWPVFGISWDDAQMYAAWLTHRVRAQGFDVTLRLPTLKEWSVAWGAEPIHRYPFGSEFRPNWVSCNYARDVPSPEPVLSFPIDESVFGVRDMSGSVAEWCLDWWNEPRGQRRICGGSWAHGGFEYQLMFAMYGDNGAPPTATGGHIGFRLVATFDE
jgi:formylglycine-generating enzyme required for sulfatase activity